jgi:hypothetical protein
MLERRTEPLLPRSAFLARFARFAGGALAVILLFLLGGAVGYHATLGLPWLEAILNAAMILSGMGPVDRIDTTSGKVFATVYALVSGVVFLTTTGLLLTPILHRLFHHFHMEAGDQHRRPR